MKPMLASTGDESNLEDPNMGWEFKFDGERAFIEVNGTVEIIARSGHNWTKRFPEIVEEASKLPGRFLFDVEIACVDENGVTNFTKTQKRNISDLRKLVLLRTTHPVTAFVFDLLILDGRYIGDLPYSERKQKLYQFLGLTTRKTIKFVQHWNNGTKLYDKALQNGEEGIVGKVLDSPYEPGVRSKSWIKLKPPLKGEFKCIGYQVSEEGRRVGTFKSLVLVDNNDRYVACVGTGFTDEVLTFMTKLLEEHKIQNKPIDLDFDYFPVNIPDLKLVVVFQQITADGSLRFPRCSEIWYKSQRIKLKGET